MARTRRGYYDLSLPLRLAQQPRARCRIVTRGKKNSVLLEFEGGERVVTSGNAIRKRKENKR